jgi:paraquat-inducible protein B
MAHPERPVVEESRGFNLFTSIWIVPLIALFISLWLVYQHFSKLGPEIRITFPNSGGLEAGQSVIRYRNVPIGKVTRIEIQEGGNGVVVIARMNKEAESFMNETARFWIVKPEVGYTGISGLETLLSGTYIAMYASLGKEDKQHFEGLKTPYRDITSGEYVLLNSKSVGGIRVGTPINYRNIQVGEVEHISLAVDGTSVEVVAFVKKEYAHLINITTKFWFQGLANIGLKGGRLDVKLAPIISYLAFGGITFESKVDKPYPKAASNYFYRLYESEYEAESKKIGEKLRENHLFTFRFKGKISGLKKGATIQYQGFDIGEVSEVQLHYDSSTHMMESKVSGDIDVSIFVDANKSGFENLQDAVEEGLRAQLVSVNPLINSLFVDLVFSKNIAPVSLLKNETEGTVFPVLDIQKSSLLDELTRFTRKLNRLEINSLLVSAKNLVEESTQPLKASLVQLEKAIESFKKLADQTTTPVHTMVTTMTHTSKNLDTTLANLDHTLGAIDSITTEESMKEVPKKLNIAIDELGKTLETTKKVLRGYRSNSLFGKRVTQMLKEINKSSEETKRLLRKLNKKPNSLLFGE